jgi:hypothetical protein
MTRRKFKQMRWGTVRANVVRLSDGTLTKTQIASRIGKTPKYVGRTLYYIKRDYGIDYDLTSGKPMIVPPKGMKISDLVAENPMNQLK